LAASSVSQPMSGRAAVAASGLAPGLFLPTVQAPPERHVPATAQLTAEQTTSPGAALAAMRGSRAQLHTQQRSLDQDEKDGRLVELLQFAAAHGCGDIEPEPAIAALEDAGWDVADALQRLFIAARAGGRRGNGLPQRVRAASGRLGTNVNTPDEGSVVEQAWSGPRDEHTEPRHLHLLQQLEWDQMLAEQQEQDLREAAARRAARRAARQAARQVSSGHLPAPAAATGRVSGGGPPGMWHPGHHGMADRLHMGGAPQGVELYHAPQGMEDELSSDGANSRREGMLDPSLFLAEHMLNAGDDEVEFPWSEINSEEAINFHALVRALIRTQDEADLQDAVRLSAEEAYSGSFGAPPADEAALTRSTRVSTYSTKQAGEAPYQCSVCLMDLEKGDFVRTLQCGHKYHVACIDQWLAQSGQCPVCKHNVS